LRIERGGQGATDFLGKNPASIDAGASLCRPGEAAGDFCTLSEGWACSYRYLDNGERQILEVFLPGDIIGLRDFSLSRRMDEVVMLEDGIFCRFSYRNMLSLFGQSLTLTAVMFAISSHQQILLSERLVSLGRLRRARKSPISSTKSIFAFSRPIPTWG
jgi:CRP-like cAMP-binding protein